MTIVQLALTQLLVTASPTMTNPPAIRIDRSVGAASQLSLEGGQNRLLVLSEEINRVAVADPAIADLKVVTPNQLLLTAKNAGSTDLTLWNRNNEPLVIGLLVSRNLEPLRRQLKELFPKENVSVSAGGGDLVVLSGEVSDVRIPERVAEVARLHANKVANLVTVSGNQQVQLEVRFAEVNRSSLRELGINFFTKSANGNVVAGGVGRGVSPGAFLPTIPGTGTAGRAAPGFPPEVQAPQFTDGFNVFWSSFPYFPFSAMLSLLEANSLAKVLAEPTLVTMSGQHATFLAGGEFPIPFVGGVGQVTVEWKKFGIVLEFTPTVINGDTLHLDMKAEVSEIDPTLSITVAGTTIPGLTSRQSTTTVRLGDGQSFAIAGLLSDRVRSQIDRVPVLGSLPILGALFRSTQYQRQETELLVVVTAHLAQPVAPHEVPPMPTDRELNHPGDVELFLFGMNSGGTAQPKYLGPAPASGGPSGARGFVRETDVR
jgi:pilus assembly protein CpaC